MVTSLRSKWAVGKAVRAGLAIEGAYLNRYVTDEQRSRRPIFNATLRAAASWLFFRVARSTRMTQIWALRSRLEKQPTDLRRRHYYMRDGTLVRLSFASEQVSPEGRLARSCATSAASGTSPRACRLSTFQPELPFPRN